MKNDENMGGFHTWGYPHSWMVYKEKSHLQMDDDWGYPHDSGNLHMISTQIIAAMNGMKGDRKRSVAAGKVHTHA